MSQKIEHLNEMSTDLLSNKEPKMEVEVDGKIHKLAGREARSAGIGVNIALKIIESERRRGVELNNITFM